MGFGFNGLSAEVQITGDVSTVPPGELDVGKTRIQIATSRDDLTSVETLYTPTSGKVLFITSIVFVHGVAAAVAVGDGITGIPSHNAATANCISAYMAANQQWSMSFSIPFKVETALKAAASSTGNFYCSFTGWEEDA